ncbi:A-kinase anchor protein 8-like [Dendropsophus ebraccatus]|uniref:A-kinase anchor protein 8-like n=1 Tax=Dendropsophus ebraccatus TaxID=150705 RepID=UPI00383106DF
MYGRSGGMYMGSGRPPGIQGYNSNNYGLMNYGQDPYRSSSQPWMNPQSGLTRESFYNHQERSRLGYPEPAGGYERQREQWPPHGGQPGWRGDPGGSYNFGSAPPAGPARYSQPPPGRGGFSNPRSLTQNYSRSGGFKRMKTNTYRGGQNKTSDRGKEPPPAKKMRLTPENKDSKELVSEEDCNAAEPDQSTTSGGQNKTSDRGKEPPPVKKMRLTPENSKELVTEEDCNPEESAQSTTSDKDQEDGKQEKSEDAQSSSKKPQETESTPSGDDLVEKMEFHCSLCQFRTLYDEEMNDHLQSTFHKDHISHLKDNLSKQEADFLQEYVQYRTRKTENQRKHVEELDNTIHTIRQNQDLTLGVGMEHFMKKVEIAYCSACDVLIPMKLDALQQHVTSVPHKNKCRISMRTSKTKALGFARYLLKNKDLKQKMKQNVNGQKEEDKKEGEETTSGGCSTDLADLEMPCITLSDSEGEDEEDSGGQVTGQENTEESSTVCDGPESTEVEASVS